MSRYQAGKADWFAAGLPGEGTAAPAPRAADLAWRDVPTCAIDARVGDVRRRLQGSDFDTCIVVSGDRVVLGLVSSATLDVDPATSAESVMDPAPLTVRPNLRIGEMPEYARERRSRRAVVTTSDGVLVGLLRLEDVAARRGG